MKILLLLLFLLSFVCMWLSRFSRIVCWKDDLAALNCLCSFIKDQFTMFMWTYFWALYPLSLIYLFILLTILPCLLKMEKTMAAHSSTLAWKIPWMEEPGRLQSMGSRRVRHDWATSLSLFPFMLWRRQWQPTPVFLPGESQGWGSLVGCHLWGRTESDMTEVT